MAGACRGERRENKTERRELASAKYRGAGGGGISEVRMLLVVSAGAVIQPKYSK